MSTHVGKSMWMIAMAMLVMAFGSTSARADTIEVGYVTVTSTTCAYQPGDYCGSATVTNLMSDTSLDIQGFSLNGTNIPVGNIAVTPGSSYDYLAWTSPPLDQYSLYGVLGNLDFTVGGETYVATALGWTSPTWADNANGEFAIDVIASPTAAATPEPNSLMLLGTGLLGLVGVAPRYRRGAFRR